MTESIGQLDKVSRTVKTAKATVDTMTAGEERHSGRSDPLGRLPTVTISNGTRAGDVSVSSLELQACSCPPRHHISCTVEGRACRLCHCELSRTPAWLACTVVRRQRSLGLVEAPYTRVGRACIYMSLHCSTSTCRVRSPVSTDVTSG